MLAAAVETEPGEEPLLPLTLESQRLWPDFARELLAATGTSCEYRDEGTLVIALNRDDAESLRHSYDFQRGLGLELDWLNAAEARGLEPHLKPGIAAAVFSRGDHQVENRALTQALIARGFAATFRATGQTGILIAGDGVSIDAVVSDFVSGAVEWLCPENDPDHWDVIEGQGSLFHASYAGVTLGLIHGAQPDALVVCHEPTRPHMRGLPGYKLPDLRLCIDRNIDAAQLTNPAARCIGLSINTSGLEVIEARDYLRQTEDRLGLPCVDPIRSGVAAIVDNLPG